MCEPSGTENIRFRVCWMLGMHKSGPHQWCGSKDLFGNKRLIQISEPTWRSLCHRRSRCRACAHHRRASAHGRSCGPSSWSAGGRWDTRKASRPSVTACAGSGGRRRGKLYHTSHIRGSSSLASGAFWVRWAAAGADWPLQLLSLWLNWCLSRYLQQRHRWGCRCYPAVAQ